MSLDELPPVSEPGLPPVSGEVAQSLKEVTDQQAALILEHESALEAQTRTIQLLRGEIAEAQRQLEVIRADRDARHADLRDLQEKHEAVHKDLAFWQGHHAALDKRVREALGDHP